MNVSKNDLFALERAYELLSDLVDFGAADLTARPRDREDFNCIKEALGEPKRMIQMEGGK